jgi:hypothetical protein
MEIEAGGRGAQSIIVNDRKLIYSYSGMERSSMLFDLGADRHEGRDLSKVEPGVRDDLRIELDRVRGETIREELQSRELELDENISEELRALGYIN